MPPPTPITPRQGSPRIIVVIIMFVLLLILGAGSFYVVQPGTRGVIVTLGKASDTFVPEGFGMKMPFITQVNPVSVRQTTQGDKAECYSQDLQQVKIDVRVIYAIPEKSVVAIFKNYYGDPFDALIFPRVQEALKEQTALLSAEQIVKQRELVKSKTLESAKQKVGDIVFINDIVLQNITLSNQLEEAIEAKMVQEQNASKAKFEQERRKIEADTKVIEAEAEAKAITIRGQALRENPDQITLQIVEKWDGRAPLVIGGGTEGKGTNIILPLPTSQTRDGK